MNTPKKRKRIIYLSISHFSYQKVIARLYLKLTIKDENNIIVCKQFQYNLTVIFLNPNNYY